MRMQCTAGNDERAHSKRRLNTQGAECGQKRQNCKANHKPNPKFFWIWFPILANGNSEKLMASMRRASQHEERKRNRVTSSPFVQKQQI